MKQLIEAPELWFHRKSLRISWIQHVRNEEVLQLTKTTKTIWTDIKERQRKYIGPVVRKEELDK